jgi:hypothetical protein
MIERPPGEVSLEGLTRGEFLKVAGAAGLVVTASGSVIAVVASPAKADIGSFGPVFVEPLIYYPAFHVKKYPKFGKSERNDKQCIPPPGDPEQKRRFCKPAAGSNGLLPDGRFLYVNALEGTEDSEAFGAGDSDKAIEDSQSRVVKINYENNRQSKFLKPFQSIGAKRDDVPTETVPGVTIGENRRGNNADLFCSSQCHLPGGEVLFVGGTNWFTEPSTVVELEGNSGSRFFDWKRNKWFETKGELLYGRWYPACIPLATGEPLTVGGVHKLEKPIYLNNPPAPGEPPVYDSGKNNRFIEKLNLKTGKWELQGGEESPTNTARISVPLQPRLKLLPNGHVAFNGCGQAFSPNGQDAEQATWVLVKTYNPKKNGAGAQTWTEHNVSGFGLAPGDVGGKYSTFEVPLLMEPDSNGDYKTMELLVAGGVLGGTNNPGTYFAVNTSRIDVFNVNGDDINYGPSVETGPLNGDPDNTVEGEPVPIIGRWFSDAALLPDGTVFISSGADRDEVVFPGAELPIKTCELFDRTDTTDSPNGTWTIVGRQNKNRTYHNTNSMLPTGQVIIGGHAPIPFGYVSHDSDVAPGTRNSDGRDPSFQIWSPAFISDPNRPEIDFSGLGPNGTKAPLTGKVGGKLRIPTTTNGETITDVVIQRVPSTTHINDLEQRGLVLPVHTASANSVSARMPKTLAELGGPGYYLAFIRVDGVPSEGVFVKVPAVGTVYPDPAP